MEEAYSLGTLTYRATLLPGWYILGASTPTSTSLVDEINLTYLTHPFNCHFDTAWGDDFMTYSGCSQASTPPPPPSGWEDKTDLPVDTTFSFTSDVSNWEKPYTYFRHRFGALQEGYYLSIQLSNPAYTTGSTPLSAITITLKRNSEM